MSIGHIQTCSYRIYSLFAYDLLWYISVMVYYLKKAIILTLILFYLTVCTVTIGKYYIILNSQQEIYTILITLQLNLIIQITSFKYNV